MNFPDLVEEQLRGRYTEITKQRAMVAEHESATEEFKREEDRLMELSGKPVGQLARDLGALTTT